MQVCKFLVESGAAVFATTYSDMQTAADKCEEMEEGYAQCSQFLYGEIKQPAPAQVTCRRSFIYTQHPPNEQHLQAAVRGKISRPDSGGGRPPASSLRDPDFIMEHEHIQDVLLVFWC